MKKILTTAIVVVMVIFFASPCNLFAGSKDTLVVYANGASLDQIINSDTTSTGAQAHSAYKLVSLDTTYIFLGAVSVKSDMTVIGVLGSNGRPPCIQPGILSDGSVPTYLFVLNGVGANYIFKNLYLMGVATNNTTNAYADAIRLLSDNIRLTVDNVIFEEWWSDDISYFGTHNSFFITNCKFRNGNQPSWYSGEVLRCLNGEAYTDTLIMKDNTILCITAYAACPLTKRMTTYFEFSHNSVLWMFKNPFWIFNVTNAKVNDNIFYATFAGGISKDEYPWWDQLWSAEVGSIIDIDTLDAVKDSILTGNSSDRWGAEKLRKVELKNNVYFTPAELVKNVKAWNDTAHVDSVYTAEWMNTRTKGIFSDKTHWPGIVESGTQNVDPGYGAGIQNILYKNTGNGSGFWQYFTDIRTSTATNSAYGYKMQSVAGDNWIPEWPLPEVSDMQYSNAALKTAGTDGKPVGDPGWFTNGYTGVNDTKVVTPGKFSLSEAYPNPFNPSTTVKFNIAKAGNVSLKIFNVMGQLVKTVLENSYRNPGEYSLNVNMNSLSSGIYFYTLTQDKQQLTKKMVLMK
jgi:hypothetical protein